MTPRRRFCMITTFYPPYNFGGDGIYVHRLANALAGQGHHVEVIHCIDTYRLMTGREPAGAYHDHPGVVVHGLRSPFGKLSPLATHQTGLPLLKGRIGQILDQGFDVIHYHNISLVGGPGVLAWGRGIKLYSLHEYWLVCPTHILFRYNREVCEHPHCLTCTLSYRRPPQVWRYTGLIGRALEHVDAFISSSRFTIEAHHARGLPLRAVHLPHFTPAPDDEGASAPDGTDEPYFLYVGRLEKYKGLHTLFPIFRRRGAARLLVAGTGTDERELRRLAAGIPNVHFLGHVESSRLHALYRRAVAVIVPTLAYEIFGMVVIEAFSHGTPAIVRNVGGMPELIAESGAGFVYTTDEELITAMDRLLSIPSLRQMLSLRGYQAYLKNWTPEVHLKRYLALIDELTAARRSPGIAAVPAAVQQATR
ncbi:MAG TPA: glycosyltransferase family 4 protein [bacterium]